MLPPKLHACKVPSALVHEAEYQELRLCRPHLGSWLRVFLHALKALSVRLNLDVSQNKGPQYRPQYSILLILGTPKMVPLILGNPHLKLHREKSLKPVPSMQVAPKELREIRPQVHTSCVL